MKTSVYIFAIIFATWSLGEARDLAFADRFSSWARNLGLGNTVEEKAVVPVRRMIDGVRDRFQRESPTDHLKYFVKRVETFLSKLVPSENFVQDLMGLPKPEDAVAPPSDLSKEVFNILRLHSPKPKPPEIFPQKATKMSSYAPRELKTNAVNFRPVPKTFYKPLVPKNAVKFPPMKKPTDPMYFFNNGRDWRKN